MDKEVKKHLNVQYGKHSLVKAKNDIGQAFSLDRGYVTDKELFKWALVGIQNAREDVERTIEKNGRDEHIWPYSDAEIQRMQSLVDGWKMNEVYLKEVLDSLG